MEKRETSGVSNGPGVLIPLSSFILICFRTLLGGAIVSGAGFVGAKLSGFV